MYFSETINQTKGWMAKKVQLFFAESKSWGIFGALIPLQNDDKHEGFGKSNTSPLRFGSVSICEHGRGGVTCFLLD